MPRGRLRTYGYWEAGARACGPGAHIRQGGERLPGCARAPPGTSRAGRLCVAAPARPARLPRPSCVRPVETTSPRCATGGRGVYYIPAPRAAPRKTGMAEAAGEP